MKEKKQPLIFYGWIIVAISLITLTIAYSTRYSFSVFYVAILNEFGWTRAETALAFSINMIIYSALSPLAGALIDRFGPRRVFPVSAVLLGLGVLGLSQLHSIWHLYLFFGLCGLGLVLTGYIAHACFLPHWFSLKLGAALGIAVVGMSISNISVLPIQSLINNIGWRGAYIVLTIIILAVLIPLTALFQRRRASDMGLPLDGIARSGGKETDRSQEDTEDLRVVDKRWASTEWTPNRAMKTRRFWVFFIQQLMIGIAYNFVGVHAVAAIVDIGYSKMFAASVFSLAGGLTILSALGGFISDRIGRELTYTLGMVGMALGVVVLALTRDTSSPWMLYLFAVLFGVCQGIDRPVTLAAEADVFRGKNLGTIMGFINLTYGAGGAFGSWLGGYIFDVHGSYLLAFVITILSFIGAVALMWTAAPRRVRIVGGKARHQHVQRHKDERH